MRASDAAPVRSGIQYSGSHGSLGGPIARLCDDSGEVYRATAEAAGAELVAGHSDAMAALEVRPEIHPVETVTLTGRQVLRGEEAGKPAVLAGVLRLPVSATGRLPAVVLLHGSAGVAESTERWARELTGIGAATFLLDCFSGRGITSSAADQSQLDALAMMVDAYRVLGMLARDPRLDADRIAVMGFSKGAVGAVYSSNQRFRNRYGPPNAEFAAHIGLYTPCYITYREDDRVTGKPMRLFHGTADDYVPVAPCRAYVERLRKRGVDATLTEYPGAHHTYDNFRLSGDGTPVERPQAQTLRKCQLIEGEDGVILNVKTGQPFDINTDPCVERGPHVAYDAAAASATLRAVREILITAFRRNEG